MTSQREEPPTHKEGLLIEPNAYVFCFFLDAKGDHSGG